MKLTNSLFFTSLVALTLACGGQPAAPAEAPAEASAAEARPVRPDEPAFGLYRLDKELAMERFIALARAHGRPEDSIQRDVDELRDGDGWLLLDARTNPLFIHTVERGEVFELDVERKFNKFMLRNAQRSRGDGAECTARSTELIECSMEIAKGAVLEVSLNRVEGQEPGLPASGIYDPVGGQDEREAFMRKFLEENEFSEEVIAPLLAELRDAPSFFLFDGPRALSMISSIVIVEGVGGDDEKAAQLDMMIDVLSVSSSAGGGFVLQYDGDAGEMALQCETVDAGFRCEVPDGSRQEYRLRSHAR